MARPAAIGLRRVSMAAAMSKIVSPSMSKEVYIQIKLELHPDLHAAASMLVWTLDFTAGPGKSLVLCW